MSTSCDVPYWAGGFLVELRLIDLTVLGIAPGIPALTPARGQFYAEAAAFCLEDRQHQQGASLNVKGLQELKCQLRWPATSEQSRRSYADTQDSTEFGAYGVAIALVKEVTGLSALHQSRKGTGFDYWIGESLDDLFQNASRLEISGILDGDDSTIKSRVKQKKRQTQRSDATTLLPAYACVVEFSRPEAHFVKR